VNATITRFTVTYVDPSGGMHNREYYQANLPGRGSKPGIGKSVTDAIEDALRQYVAKYDTVTSPRASR
jgi:hypothetical protein